MQSIQRISKKTQSLAKQLDRLRNGPASLTLPNGVKELEMIFASRNRDYGARRFLRRDIPSLLYTNPKLTFKQQRPERVEAPTMVIRYDDNSEKTLELKDKPHADILYDFLTLFNAQPSSKASLEAKMMMEESEGPSSKSQRTRSTSNKIASSSSSQSSSRPIIPPPPPPPSGEVEAGVDVGTARE